MEEEPGINHEISVAQEPINILEIPPQRNAEESARRLEKGKRIEKLEEAIRSIYEKRMQEIKYDSAGKFVGLTAIESGLKEYLISLVGNEEAEKMISSEVKA